MAPWVLLPLVTLWHHVAFLVSAGSATNALRKQTHGLVHRSVEVPVQGGQVQPTMARIGTKEYHSETVPSVNMLPGYRTGSFVWLVLDPDTFMDAKVQQAVLDKNGCVMKYKLWLDSDCLTEAHDGQLVQPLSMGCCVSVTAFGEVCTAQIA